MGSITMQTEEEMWGAMKLRLEGAFNSKGETEKLFLDWLYGQIKTHRKEAKKHKDLYFAQNTKTGKQAFWSRVSRMIWNNPSVRYVVVILPTTLFFAALPVAVHFWEGNLPWLIFLLYEIIVFAGSIFVHFRAERGRRDLELRRHGETWVRHSCAEQRYYAEIFRFLNGTGEYRYLDPKNRKKLFQKNIIALFEKNIDIFSENMKHTREWIE